MRNILYIVAGVGESTEAYVANWGVKTKSSDPSPFASYRGGSIQTYWRRMVGRGGRRDCVGLFFRLFDNQCSFAKIPIPLFHVSREGDFDEDVDFVSLLHYSSACAMIA